jgi:anti-anti-sigma regulatory factor
MGFLAVELLARLHLTARRRGLELRIAASPELRELIAFCGLEEVLAVELQREPEEREELCGLEEERELLDPGA